MNYSKKRKLLFVIIALVIISTCVFFIGGRYLMKKRLGGYTERINPRPYFTVYTTIGIKNVNILKPDASKFIPNQQVILKNGIIQKIDSSINLSSSFPYIDGKGKYLIPGLVDTHVHLHKYPSHTYFCFLLHNGSVLNYLRLLFPRE